MTEKDTLTPQQIDDILHILDDTIQKGPWDQSNFLKAVGKNISDIRTNFASHVKASHEDTEYNQQLASQAALRSGMKEVYVSLYSVDASLASWERIVINLPKQNISRPIYHNEEDVQSLIKSKEKRLNEAYIAMYINESDIITMDSTKVIVDKFGKPLLTLKGNALRLDNIHYFVHDGVMYQFSDGQLVKKT